MYSEYDDDDDERNSSFYGGDDGESDGEGDRESDGFDEEELSDDGDEENLQKLNRQMRNEYVDVYHPENRTHNYEEILNMTRIVRDKNGNIVDEFHRTVPILSKYEKTRLLGLRAKQISEGAQIFVEVDDKIVDGYLIALKELEMKKMPFIIRRPIPGGGSEYWRLADLEIV